MEPDLQDVYLMREEIEQLCGLEVSDLLIGGLWGGTYRSGAWRSLRKVGLLLFTEVALLILGMILALPLGLLATRNLSGTIADPQTMLRFVGIMAGFALLFLAVWNVYVLLQLARFRVLNRLLDEIDQYNAVVKAVDLMDQLKITNRSHGDASTEPLPPENGSIDRIHLLKALTLSRESLVCGLMTDRILRENHSLLNQSMNLIAQLETNLTSLQTMALEDQAGEYARLLGSALQIGTEVHQVLRRQHKL